MSDPENNSLRPVKVESNEELTEPVIPIVKSYPSEIGSGGWSFGSHSGPSNHRLRIERFDQSQGYEPCGLNLDRLLLRESTPPRYTRRTELGLVLKSLIVIFGA